MDEILEYLKSAKTYFLATVGVEGDPHVRPFGTIAKIDGALYIQTGMRKNCFKQTQAHPRVAISAMGADGSWLVMEADTTAVTDVDTCEAMLQQYPELRPMYTPGDGNTVVLRLSNAVATISSFTAEPKQFEF